MKIEEINIYEISLDDENPRIENEIKEVINKPPQLKFDFQKKELRNASKDELRKSILELGGITTPIKVIIDKEGYKVFEGNTRLAIYREYDEAHPDQDQWKKIKAIVYPELSRQELIDIRITDHLVGVKEWTPYSKATHIKKLMDEDNLTLEDISKKIGVTSKLLFVDMQALDYMNNHYQSIVDLIQQDLIKINNDQSVDTSFEVRRFTAFQEYFQRENEINEAIKSKESLFVQPKYISLGYKDCSSENAIAYFCALRKFNRNEHVRRIKEIFMDDEATEKFLRFGSKEAIKVIDGDKGLDIQKFKFLELCKEISRRLGNNQIKQDEISEIENDLSAQAIVEETSSNINAVIKEWVGQDDT